MHGPVSRDKNQELKGAGMDWSLLADFLMIARSGSLTGAAQKLGINHSTIYRRLNQLESQLGCRLFERLPTGYRLTAEGAMLLHVRRRVSWVVPTSRCGGRCA